VKTLPHAFKSVNNQFFKLYFYHIMNTSEVKNMTNNHIYTMTTRTHVIGY